MTWLRSAALADGRVVDIRLDPVAGTIAEVSTARRLEPRNVDRPSTGAGDIDLDGYLVLPAPVEPHAHLDKALTADRIPNPKGDLLGAIQAWIANLGTLNVDEIAERAKRAAIELVMSGTTAIRTHVNVDPGLGTDAVEALIRVRDDLAAFCDIQIVALCGTPLTADAGREYRAIFRDALLTDRHVFVGGCPHLDPSPLEASNICFEMAMQFGRPIDLHTDETLDPAHLELRYLAQRVRESGFDLGASASHCVSLAMQPETVQREVSSEVAAAGVAVITLPQTNLFLQGRDHHVATPRGLTAIRPLLEAGVVVGAGADNVRDPFNSMGRSDPLETASLLVMAGHLLPHEAYTAVSDHARRAMGLPVVRIEVGSPAELIAVRGSNIADAIARADQDRYVWHRGRLVASVAVTRTLHRSDTVA